MDFFYFLWFWLKILFSLIWFEFILSFKVFKILFMSLLFEFIFLLLIFFIKFFEPFLKVLIVLGLNLRLLFFHFRKEWFDTFSLLWKLFVFPVLLFLEILKNQKWSIRDFTSFKFLSISFYLIRCEIPQLQFHWLDFFIQLIFDSFNFRVVILLLFDDDFVTNNLT